MNLTRQISTTTDFDEAILLKKILAVLEEDRYGIKRLTNNIVEFSQHNGGLRWNFEYFGLLDSGEFSVERSDDKNVVKLTYLAIPLSEIVFVIAIFLFFAIFGIINEVYGSFFVGFVFLMLLVFKYFNLRSVAESMLHEIVQQ